MRILIQNAGLFFSSLFSPRRVDKQKKSSYELRLKDKIFSLKDRGAEGIFEGRDSTGMLMASFIRTIKLGPLIFPFGYC